MQYYLTINEPLAMCGYGYGQNYWPPGQNKGDSEGKYLCNHIVNFAHGSVVQMARKKYAGRDFKFGMPLIIAAGVPATNSQKDKDAAYVMMDQQAQTNWGPITSGNCNN